MGSGSELSREWMKELAWDSDGWGGRRKEGMREDRWIFSHVDIDVL